MSPRSTFIVQLLARHKSSSHIIQQMFIDGIHSLFNSVKCDYITHCVCLFYVRKKKKNKLTVELKTKSVKC